MSPTTQRAITLYRAWSMVWQAANRLEQALRAAVEAMPNDEVGDYLRATNDTRGTNDGR